MGGAYLRPPIETRAGRSLERRAAARNAVAPKTPVDASSARSPENGAARSAEMREGKAGKKRQTVRMAIERRKDNSICEHSKRYLLKLGAPRCTRQLRRSQTRTHHRTLSPLQRRSWDRSYPFLRVFVPVARMVFSLPVPSLYPVLCSSGQLVWKAFQRVFYAPLYSQLNWSA